MKNKWMVIPALAGAVVLGGGLLVNSLGTNEAYAAENFISLKEAKVLAVEKVGGKVTEIELEKTKSGYVYEVEVTSNGIEYDLDIDAHTGKVEIEKQKSIKVELPKEQGKKVLTKKQAIEIALKHTKGTVIKVETDDDKGRKHYDIDLKDGEFKYELEIDAITGEVFSVEKERLDGKKENNQGSTVTKFLTKDQAIAIAQKKAKGVVTDIDLDDDDDEFYYEIEIKDGKFKYEFEIDAVTGKIVKFEKERDNDKKIDNQLNGGKKLLTKDQAIAIAMKQAKGKVTDIELDDDDDRYYYEIEIKDGASEYEFKIDAITGKVVKFKQDHDDDNDDDDDDDLDD